MKAKRHFVLGCRMAGRAILGAGALWCLVTLVSPADALALDCWDCTRLNNCDDVCWPDDVETNANSTCGERGICNDSSWPEVCSVWQTYGDCDADESSICTPPEINCVKTYRWLTYCDGVVEAEHYWACYE
jgi:hypothetical protein